MTTKVFNALAAATTLAGIVATAGAANAATLTQSVDYTPSDPDTGISADGYYSTDINDIISVKQFDPKLGTLNSVKIDFTSSLEGDAGFENRSSSAATAIVKLAGVLKLQLPKNVDLFELDPSQSSSYSLAKYDKKTDYAGASGKTVSGLTASLSDTKTFTNNSFLQYFLGKGTTNFNFLATATSTVTGSGNFASYIDTYAKAGITVTYDYTAKAVPEPSALLGIGVMAGFGIISKKKKWLKLANS